MQLSLHLMLYCGIRPTEVSRIDPERDIDWQNRRVVVRPTTSKTGGGRVVTLRKAEGITVRTIPRHWAQRWRALRKAAGWDQSHPWRQDACCHTFAKYHAAYFRNLPALQLEMGHRDTELLRTRHVYASCGAERNAKRFFETNAQFKYNPLHFCFYRASGVYCRSAGMGARGSARAETANPPKAHGAS